MPTDQKLFLIDAMSLIFRAFHAPMQMGLVSPSGVPTTAVYIFIRTVRKLLKDYQPAYVGVAFDLAAPTFRDELFEEYKANRPSMPEDLAVQLPYVRHFCQALRIPLVEKEGYEADDVIGTLAKRAQEKGVQVFIVSGDKDLAQLVNGQTSLLKTPRTSRDPYTLMVANDARVPKSLPKDVLVKTVEEVLGVKPSQVVDWLAVAGDEVDNIPGARPMPGHAAPKPEGGRKRTFIGKEGAKALVKKFGSLDTLLDRIDEVEKQSYRDALRDYRKEALLSRPSHDSHGCAARGRGRGTASGPAERRGSHGALPGVGFCLTARRVLGAGVGRLYKGQGRGTPHGPGACALAPSWGTAGATRHRVCGRRR